MLTFIGIRDQCLGKFTLIEKFVDLVFWDLVYENIMIKNTVVYFISTVQGKFEAFRYEMIKD